MEYSDDLDHDDLSYENTVLVKDGYYYGYLEPEKFDFFESEEHEQLFDRYYYHNLSCRSGRPSRLFRKAHCRVRLKSIRDPLTRIVGWQAKLRGALLENPELNCGTLKPFAKLQDARDFFQRFGIEVSNEIPAR